MDKFKFPSLSQRISTFPFLISVTAFATFGETVPNFGFGIMPFGPRTFPNFPTLDIMSGAAAPDMMSKVGKLGKVLGPKGIMPNPKFGTVSPNVAKAVTDIKNGKVEIRCDKDGNLNLSIGRVNFDDSKIIENFKSVYDVIEKEKPVGLKGNYIKNIFVTNSMGPSVKLNLAN